MQKLLSLVGLLLMVQMAQAQDRLELGIGAGSTHPVMGEGFRSAATSGNSQHYWLGYGLDQNWAVELGLDNLDFDGADSKHRAIALSGVYRFMPASRLHPIAKLGLTSVESKDSADVKTNSMGAKAAYGLEYDCKYVSVGALLNFFHIQKSDDTLDFENTQAIVGSVFLTIHNALGAEEKVQSQAVAPAAAAAPVAQDSDKDGVNDDDDKCPGTPEGVVVNKIGCSEKEKASVRLNVSFASGKSDLTSDSNDVIQKLADFMKKFPDTKVEIAGHTDSLGNAKANDSLSQKRADSVKAALVQSGVEESRLAAKGYGSSQPVADNKTKAGRDQNRRVNAEISIDIDKKK